MKESNHRDRASSIVVICAVVSALIFIGSFTIGKEVSAEFRPVLNAEPIEVFDYSIHQQVRVFVSKSIRFWNGQDFRAECSIHYFRSRCHPTSMATSEDPPGSDRVGCFPDNLVLSANSFSYFNYVLREFRVLIFGNNVDIDNHTNALSWCFPCICKSDGHIQRSSNHKTPRYLLRTVGFPEIGFYPWALILPHLSLDGPNAVLGSFGLFIRNSELSLDSFCRFDGIRCSLLGLGIQDVGLFLHLPELAIEHHERHGTHDKEEGSEDHHPPVGIAKPIHGFLWILAGAVMDIFSMWLIRIRSRNSNSGREWGGCIALALLILCASLFPIVHGTDLILGV